MRARPDLDQVQQNAPGPAKYTTRSRPRACNRARLGRGYAKLGPGSIGHTCFHLIASEGLFRSPHVSTSQVSKSGLQIAGELAPRQLQPGRTDYRSDYAPSRHRTVERPSCGSAGPAHSSKDYEKLCASSEAVIPGAMSRLMLRRLACP